MSWTVLKERYSQKVASEIDLPHHGSKEKVQDTENVEEKPQVKRYRNKHMKKYPELYRSDVSTHPSYTGLKTLPYYVIARRRVQKTRNQINRQLNWEINHMAMMQTYALSGVRIDRSFSIGFPPEAASIPDFATDKERRRINDLIGNRLSILYSCGAAPLELWEMHVKNGYIRRVTDDEVNSLALEIAGTNVSTTYIISPKDPKTQLGICLPFLIMVIKNMRRYFTFEITILDDQRMHRRFRASNFQSVTRVRPFSTTMPINLGPGWNQIQFNLAEFTRRAYGTNYVETTRMQVHANCRIRRIYFADRLYDDSELPDEYRLLFPKKAEESRKPSAETSKTSVDKESKRSYEEGYGEDFGEESIASRTLPTPEDTARLSIHVPLGDYEEEEEEEDERRSEVGIDGDVSESRRESPDIEGQGVVEGEGEAEEGREGDEKEGREEEEEDGEKGGEEDGGEANEEEKLEEKEQEGAVEGRAEEGEGGEEAEEEKPQDAEEEGEGGQGGVVLDELGGE